MITNETLFEVNCKCGWRSIPKDTLKAAEVAGDLHEGFRVVRPHAHDTYILEVR